MATTTCQICGRPIQANTGIIAHHGYKRPGNGWQTASCMGARHLPYEQSCDLIPVAITSVTKWIETTEAAIVALMSTPPETLTEYRKRGWTTETVTAEKPAEFDPNSAHRTYRRNAYDTLFFERIYSFEQNIKAAKSDLEFLSKRLADWKAPQLV